MCGRTLEPPKRTQKGRIAGRRRRFCSDACRKRHARAAETVEVPTPTSHVDAARQLVEAVKVLKADDYSEQDRLEAVQLVSIAGVADADPTVSALRELRLATAEFRKLATPPMADDEFEELAMVVARLTGRVDGTHERVFEAAIAAGATPDVAQAAAEAACRVP